MPLRIEIKINETTLKVLHIARMSHNGLSKNSVNEYSVVIDTGKLNGLKKEFVESPEEWEWEASDMRFEHCYGDSELICLDKALEAVRTASVD